MPRQKGYVAIPRELLERLYLEEGLTTQQIGERVGVSRVTIGNRLREYGIERRPRRRSLPPELLARLYHEEGLTQMEIAAQLGVSDVTVRARMQEYGIEARGHPVDLPEEEVRRLYYDERWSQSQIAAHFGVDTGLISGRMRRWGMEVRTRQEYAAETGTREELERLYYEEGRTLKQIAAHFGVTDGTIRNRMKGFGSGRRRRGSTRAVSIPHEELHRLYVAEGLDGPTIAARYGCSSSLIYARLKECGIRVRPLGSDKRKTTVAPERLDWSPGFAYLVGLIASDGSLKRDGSEVKFTSTDRELCDSYCRLLGLRPDDVPPEAWPDPRAEAVHLLYTEKPYDNKSIYRIAFSDPTFRARLEGIGLTPNKSNTIGPLAIPDAYFRDFLRGEFDGDGSWYVATSEGRRYLRSNIVSGSAPFREWLFDTIHRLSPVVGGHLFHNALWFAMRDSERLGSFMYYDANVPCLSRKRAIWAEWMDR